MPRPKKRARRAYRSGSVFPARGKWVAQVTLPGKPRRYITRWRRTKPEAEDALDELLEEHGPTDIPDDSVHLEDFLRTWLRAVKPGVRPSTAKSYSSQIDTHIVPLLGSIAIGRLRPSDIERLIAHRIQQGAKPASIQVTVAVLSAALNWAVRDGVLRRNVAQIARHPHVSRRPVIAITPDEARAIIEATKDHAYGPLYALLLGSGLRISEALALDWGDIDLKAATVTIRGGKTARSRRTVSLPRSTVAALQRYRLGRGDPGKPVFVSLRTGNRLTNAAAYSAFLQLLRQANLRSMRLHDLRHGHATLLLAAGTDMRVIADQLGHSSPSLTANVYAHVLAGQQDAAVKRLDDLLRSG